MDFVSDALFRRPAPACADALDVLTREALAIVVDKGITGEQVANALDAVIAVRGDNAFVESFNGRLREECLNAHWFLSLADAKAKIEAWRRFYDESRPHAALGDRTPRGFASLAGVNRGQ
jgi:putative transposase